MFINVWIVNWPEDQCLGSDKLLVFLRGLFERKFEWDSLQDVIASKPLWAGNQCSKVTWLEVSTCSVIEGQYSKVSMLCFQLVWLFDISLLYCCTVIYIYMYIYIYICAGCPPKHVLTLWLPNTHIFSFWFKRLLAHIHSNSANSFSKQSSSIWRNVSLSLLQS